MTTSHRQHWPTLIAELEQAGITHYKLSQLLTPRCQVHQVKRWANEKMWQNGTEPRHFVGEQIRAIHREHVTEKTVDKYLGITYLTCTDHE